LQHANARSGQVFDHTLNKFNETARKAKPGVGEAFKAGEKALQAVFSRPPEPTGMLAALKRGAYDKAMDALEPIYQRAKKLAKQAEQVLQSLRGCKADPQLGIRQAQQGRPGLVQRVETHRDERLDASRRQQRSERRRRPSRGRTGIGR
jgi:hypothetical protein